MKHHQAGCLREAEQLYLRVLAQQPHHIIAIHHLGILAHQAGRNDVAIDLIHQAIALSPNYAEAYGNLGIALASAGRIDEAFTAYRQAIALNPNLPDVYNNLGNALRHNGQLEEAIATYRRAIVLRPDLAVAYDNLGIALKESERPDEAIDAYRQAVIHCPGYAEAHNNLANLLADKGQSIEAIAAYYRAIALKPDYALAYFNLGTVLGDNGPLDEAIAAYRQAIVLRPDLVEAHSNLGNVLKEAGRLDEAIAAFRRCTGLGSRSAAVHSNLIYTLQFHPGYNSHQLAVEQRQWNRQYAVNLPGLIQAHGSSSRQVDCGAYTPGRRLRIGYLSPDFREHCQSLFTMPLLSHHDRAQFEIFCYADVVRPDAITRQLQGHADVWRNIVGMPDQEVAELIRHDQIDILVDLTMHMARNRLLVFARKPAPVQACWLAYPGSTGLTAIDYRLSDPYLDPPGRDELIYSEKTIRLADTFWCYDPLEDWDIPVNSLPARDAGTITFGCLNNFCKINDDVLDLWAQVMGNVEGSRLLLLAKHGSHQARLADRMRQAGIDPRRIEFLSPRRRRDYLQLYHRVDLCLDTFPYNGHTTSLDSFWMGVPVVTLAGPMAVSRAGLCQASNLGLSELAAQSSQQFVAIASELASDLARLGELRSTLRARMERSPLMDAPKFAASIEAAYRSMWNL
ncbi:MAG TPA: tetratricopeptide repeat protein [Humisphaera sp.]|nr:tetratricopeptide repeat protein [Humisphaera sp.]